MSMKIEVYYRGPTNMGLEETVKESVRENGGRVTFREGPDDEFTSGAIVLTCEFRDVVSADAAAAAIRALGHHVEGPGYYGDD